MGESGTTLRPETCNCLALRRATRLVTQHYDHHLAPAGLTSTQFWLLSRLIRRGPVTINEIARVMMADRTTVGRTLKPLEAAGLIVIRISDADRRARMVEPTEEGRARVQAALPLWQAAQDRFEDSYGAARAAELRHLLAEVKMPAEAL